MLHRILLFAGLFISLTGTAQKKANPENFAKNITATGLKTHLTIIAGAEMEGRDTPSPGLEKAADYIAEQFKKAGLKPGNNGSFRQTYQLSKDSVDDLTLSINGKNFIPYTDFAPYLMQNENIGLQFSEYAFVGYGIDDGTRNDYSGIDVKNKLVVIVSGFPKNYTSAKQGRLSPSHISNKIKTATNKGVKAILIVVKDLPARYNLRTTYRPVAEAGKQNNQPVPIFSINENVVSAVAGETLSSVLSALDNNMAPLKVNQAEINIKYNINKSLATASNVLGVVEGSDKKDEYLFITAHYDHVGKDAEGNIYYGADDDGSGTVSVIEMAQAFAKAKKAGHGPRRTVVFMTVSGEEKGLWGSEYYSDHPIFPLEKTTAGLNIDMIGRTGSDYLNKKDSINYVYVIGDDKLSTDLTPITEAVNNKYTKLKLDRKFNDPNDPERIYYRSDHYNFARKGVPVIFYFDGIHADYHKPTDTVDKINFPLMTKRAQLVFYTAWEIANRDGMLKRDLKLP